MNNTLVIAVCGALGFGIVWALLGAREADKKINQVGQDQESGEDLP